jgi:hypothetical protein
MDMGTDTGGGRPKPRELDSPKRSSTSMPPSMINGIVWRWDERESYDMRRRGVSPAWLLNASPIDGVPAVVDTGEDPPSINRGSNSIVKGNLRKKQRAW